MYRIYNVYIADKKSKRCRKKTSRFEFDELDNEEQRMIQLAVRNSMKETKRATKTVPEAPTFRPTREEFKDPLQYIQK